MKNRLQRVWRSERGMSLIFVGMGFMAFMAATTIAIDVGMFMTARSQAQNAADAGAHAGAVALVQNSYTDRSATGPAVLSAINSAHDNKVIGASPSVLTTDVTFPPDPNGIYDRVKVNVYRNTSRNNSVPTFLGQLFGVPSVN